MFPTVYMVAGRISDQSWKSAMQIHSMPKLYPFALNYDNLSFHLALPCWGTQQGTERVLHCRSLPLTNIDDMSVGSRRQTVCWAADKQSSHSDGSQLSNRVIDALGPHTFSIPASVFLPVTCAKFQCESRAQSVVLKCGLCRRNYWVLNHGLCDFIEHNIQMCLLGI